MTIPQQQQLLQSESSQLILHPMKTKMLPRRIAKLLKPLKGRRNSRTDATNKVKTLTVLCTANHTTEDVLAQLQDVSQNKHVTCLVLREMIQRPDNAQLFSRIQDLLRESKYFLNVRSIHLVEPHVQSSEYRRWCFKKTNFLQRVRKEARERHINVTIHGTLILDSADDSSSSSDDEGTSTSQNVSGWLSLLQQLPQDPDITSLWFYLREPKTKLRKGKRRPSQLELQQSPVQKVFAALVELFNADTRRWQFINCHIVHPQGDEDNNERAIEDFHEEQTQSLLEVAELFGIPLQVQWQSVVSDDDSANPSARIVSRMTQAAMHTRRGGFTGDAALKQPAEDCCDNTSTTVGMDGSSGAFTAFRPHE